MACLRSERSSKVKHKKCMCGNEIGSEAEYFVAGEKEQLICSVECFSKIPPIKFLIKRNKNGNRVPLTDFDQAHLNVNWLNPYNL